MRFQFASQWLTAEPACRTHTDFLSTCVSIFLMWVMAWSPASEWLLTQLTGISPELFGLCVVPLRLFTLWPPAVALRSYTQSLVLRERRTERLAPAGQ